jgi:DNA-binding GntR family transcriptional regulator
LLPGAARKLTVPEIYRELRQRICLLDLAPGARLPEEALATEFGVSRTPIRQVLDRLQHEGLVVQRPGAGTWVAGVDAMQVRDVWAVRLKIAELVGDFVRLPAPPVVLEELDRIRAELDAVRRSRDLRTLGRLYNRYNDAVLAIISNDTLRGIHDVLYHQTARVWMQFLPEMDLDAEIDIMTEELEQTLEAMRGADGQALAAVRTTHMRLLLGRFNDHVARPIG